MVENRHVVVIGAGPAGLTAALQLSRAGIRVTVCESRLEVGGLTRSFSLWDQRVDLGPHRFFSRDRRVNALWLEMAGGDYHMVNRVTRILYNGRLFSYPLRVLDVLTNLGVREASLCIGSYFLSKLRSQSNSSHATFESWVTSRFGSRLFGIFFKGYSEKLWGLPCNRISADFAAQRIRGLSLREAIINAFPGLKRPHRTLVEQFAYPTLGAGAIYESMARCVVAEGGELRLGCRIQKVIQKGRQVTGVELVDGTWLECTEVVSTMPLNLLVAGLEDVPESVRALSEDLKFRNTVIVYLRVEGSRLFPDNWIYVHSPEIGSGRITNFSNWGDRDALPSPHSILALEYWCNNGDPIWNLSDEALTELASRDLGRSGLIGDAPITHSHVERINRCYPVYEMGYQDRLDPIRNYLKTIRGLHPIGRYGTFKYNNQDHSILMGLMAAENIISGTAHDLWEINTDYDEYQESAIITETGLVEIQSEMSDASIQAQ